MPPFTQGFLRKDSLLPLLLFALTGCQAMQLENHTIRQARTLSDLQYRQVMDNLAAVANNPASLPYFSAAQTGTTTIVVNPTVTNVVNWDLITATGALFNMFIFDKGMITTTYTQQNTETWSTSPSLDPLQLYMMQGLYRKALGLLIPSPQQTVLDAYFTPPPKEGQGYGGALTHVRYSGIYLLAMRSLYESIGPGWFGVGKKHDVPKDACYVGHHCDCYVWVLPGGMEALTNLTIAIIDVGTVDTSTLTGAPRTPKPSPPGQYTFPPLK